MLCFLVVGLPAFIADAPAHAATFKTLRKCCEKHINRSCQYLFEMCTLFAAWRSYRIVVQSAMYGVLVPAACLAEAFPLRFCPTVTKFSVGLFSWIGVVVGAAITTKTALYASSDSFDRTNDNNVTNSLLTFTLCLSGVLTVIAVTVSRRTEYSAPPKMALTSSHFTWSHVLSIITPPMETVQLAAVVLFFFWDGMSKV